MSSPSSKTEHLSSHDSSDDEYDSDEPPALQLNLDKLKALASKNLRAECTRVDKRTRGASHEIFVLRFLDSSTAPESLARARFSCIARFSRVRDDPSKTTSEVATMRYVRQHTTIPVPEIYHYDSDPNNEIGAPFQLMERLPGLPLCKIWDSLTLNHQKLVLAQIASVVAQLATLQFNQIGSLTSKDGTIGPVHSPIHPHPKGPFPSTLAYLSSFINPDDATSPTLQSLYREIQSELSHALNTTFAPEKAPYLHPPFALLHTDLNWQNLLSPSPPPNPQT